LIKSGEVRTESYLLTAAVLAIGYLFTSESYAFWASYILIFLGSVAYNYNPSAALSSPAWPEFLSGVEEWIAHHLALSAVILVATLHAIERFNSHVVGDYLFPDWRK
jgi:ABC-type dipeptide/oligopeptide/nickel transport system permease component